MIVFIDDSGDPGFSNKQGVSSHLVIACVIFDDELIAEKCAVSLKELRRELFEDDVTEFKFNKSRKKVRVAFLQCISHFSFRIRAIIMDKAKIRSIELKNSKDSFYNFTIKQVLQYSHGSLRNAKIRLDGHGDRQYRKIFLSYLRRELNSKKAKVARDIKLVDSKTNILIQMADMIAGSLRRSYDKEKTDCDVYRNILRSKIEDCWEFR